MKQVRNNLVQWLQEQVGQAGGEGIVFGLSGGVDSAALAGLARAAFPREHVAVIMPCHSDPQDVADARDVASELGVHAIEIDLSGPWDVMIKSITEGELASVADASGADSTMAAANIKPRLRMAALYYLAARRNYLVAGAENRVELGIGYFTKFGDGGADLFPLGSLVKKEVCQLAASMGVPDAVTDKVPTAGLWPGQTDEDELGMAYDVLDQFFLTGAVRPEVKERISAMIDRTDHKRRMPPVPDRAWVFKDP